MQKKVQDTSNPIQVSERKISHRNAAAKDNEDFEMISSRVRARMRRIRLAQQNFERFWKRRGLTPAEIRRKLAGRPNGREFDGEMFEVR